MDLLGAGPLLVIPRPVRAIAKRCTVPDNRMCVLIRAVSQGESQHSINLIAPDSPSTLLSILRTSAFKTHLKKHGEEYLEAFIRQDTSAMVGGSTGSIGIEEEQSTIQPYSRDQVNTLTNISDDWESFLSLPDVACRCR